MRNGAIGEQVLREKGDAVAANNRDIQWNTKHGSAGAAQQKLSSRKTLADSLQPTAVCLHHWL